ncbi:lysophospholipase [Leptospira ryugenii]|uniref:Lysophospholipase n=1 Tax=Leptospira ryugenii TaxID=1917863 RepID=A0A2P2E1Z8_9LEPT|nr:alpha/beta hydrolase [Leptospira ryugenii]GBF50933.1 lysophospholipase [Leptospira ryugenii]
MKSKKIFLYTLGLVFSCQSIQDRPDTYLQTTYWHRYQRFLPEDLRFQHESLPQEEMISIQGYQIHLDRYPKPAAPCKILLIHGGGGNGRLLGAVALGLRSINCEIISPDLPGFGLSKIPKSKSYVKYEEWVKVLSELIERERNPNQKIFLFGLSIGGMLAYHTAASNLKVDGLIATTLVDPRQTKVRDAISSNLFLSRLGMPLNSGFAFFTNGIYLPIRWLSKMESITNDPDFSDVFAGDPYAGGSRVSLGFLKSFLTYQPELEPEEFHICPVLLAHPGIDPWTPLPLSQDFYDRLPGKKEFVELTGAGHFPYEEPGKTLLFAAAKRFIERRLNE